MDGGEVVSWFEWLLDLRNSKIVALLIFFSTFVAILYYIYGNRKRSERLESYRDIPFRDEHLDFQPEEKLVKSNKDDSQNDGK